MNGARICAIIDRCQAGSANRIDAELLATLSGDAPIGHQRDALFAAANTILDGDLLEALSLLNNLELAP